MRLAAALLLIPLAVPGQESDAAALIRRLRSEDLLEREKALEALRNLGDAAVPELEKHSKDPDPDVAAHVGRLLAAAKIRKTLTPRLLAVRPGIEHRLAADPRQWIVEYLFEYEIGPAGPSPHLLFPEDTEALAVEAFTSAPDSQRRVAVIRQAGGRSHAAVVPHLADRLDYAAPQEVEAVGLALSCMQNPDGAPALLGFLARPFSSHQIRAGLEPFRPEALGPALAAAFPKKAQDLVSWLDLVEHFPSPALVEGLRRIIVSRSVFAGRALEALHRCDSKSALALARTLLKDPSAPGRAAAVEVLDRSGSAEDWKSAESLAADPVFDVRRAVLRMRLNHEVRRRRELLQGAIEGTDSELAAYALTELQYDGEAGAVDLLRHAKTHPAAFRALLQTDHEAAGAVAASSLEDAKDGIASDALSWLYRRRWRPAAKTAEVALARAREDGPRMELLACWVSTGASELPDSAFAALDAMDPDVRESAVSWLETLRLKGNLKGLVARLKEEGTRPFAARLIAAIPDPAALAALRPLAGDPSVEVRTSVARALRRWGSAADLETLRGLFKDEAADVRVEALQGLLRLDPRPAVLLAAAMGDPDSEVKDVAMEAALVRGDVPTAVSAIRVLGEAEAPRFGLLARGVMQRRSEETLEILERGWEVDNGHSRSEILEAVAALRLKAGGKLIDRALKEGPPELRADALAALAVVDASRAVPLLAEGMRAGPGGLRCKEILQGIQEPGAVADLEKLLEGSDPSVQRAALTALAGLGRPTPLAKIRPFLNSRYAALRIEAVRWAGAVGDREAASAIVAGLSEDRPEALLAAIWAAASLRVAEAAPALKRLRTHPRHDIARAALFAWLQVADTAETIAYLKAEAGTDPYFGSVQVLTAGEAIDTALTAGTGSADRNFALTCERLLVARGHSSRTAILRRWLGDPGRQEDAIFHVRNTGLKELRPDVRERLKDPSPWVRQAAIDAVVHLEGPPAWAALAPLATDPVWRVRLRAVQQVARVHVPEAEKALRARLEDPWADVRWAAAAGLVRLGCRDAAETALGRPMAVAQARTSWAGPEDEFTEAVPADACNALRDPDGYRRLTAWSDSPPKTRRELLKRIEAATGRPVDVPPSWDFGELDAPCAMEPASGSIVDWLRSVRCGDSPRLDPDRVRWLPIENAVEFWHRWLMGAEK